MSEALARRDVFPEVVSANFPAAGKAVINWTRRAFSVSNDTITILVNGSPYSTTRWGDAGAC